MDPEANIKEQREIANELIDGPRAIMGNRLEDHGRRLAELVLALDEWLSKGGFPPNTWHAPHHGGHVPDQRDVLQVKVHAWGTAAFGENQMVVPQRGVRLLEEAIEAYQACGGTPEMAHKLIDYIFARPVGELGQELGGLGVTILALAEAAGLSADVEERREVERVLSKPIKHFTDRNAAKNAAGFLAVPDK